MFIITSATVAENIDFHSDSKLFMNVTNYNLLFTHGFFFDDIILCNENKYHPKQTG